MKKSISLALAAILLLSLFSITSFASDSLDIKGQGVERPYIITLDGMQKLPSAKALYSTVNNFPTKKIIAYSGVMLEDILKEALIKDEAAIIKVSSGDGFAQSFTTDELLGQKRYFYPNILSDNSEGAIEVRPMIALMSGESIDSLTPCEPTLVMGQRSITEQTNPYFCKAVSTIEVITDEPLPLDYVLASPASGELSLEEEITLSHPNTRVKIYYTLDGSEPTLDSPIYNPSTFQPELNRPIKLTEGGTIKAMAVLPGRLNSPVASFTYKAPALSFSDLTGYGWAESSIYGLVDEGILNGMGGGLFAPGEGLTRAQFAKMVVLALDRAEPADAKGSKFPDVGDKEWYAGYVERAAGLGLIEGYADGAFRPERGVTREEMYAIIVRAMGFESTARGLSGKGLESIGYRNFEDISDWASGYIEMAEDLELVEHGHIALALTGEDGDFLYLNGRAPALRAEAAESVSRMMARMAQRAQMSAGLK